MIVIPVINCEEFDCVESKLGVLAEMFPDVSERWIHIDVADGGFTGGYTTWRNAEDLKKLNPKFKIEVHLMVHHPESILESWLEAGVSRVIIHLESTENLMTIVSECRQRKVEVMLALNPDTPVEHAFSYLGNVDACQLLAVTPGKAGQTLQAETIERIKKVRNQFPSLPIEIDGGITLETAKACNTAGATQVAAGTYIFSAENPDEAYRLLEMV